MNAELQTGGAWIFVSHSHRDLAKVRPIRNEFERRGHNPLLFFLKCLEADEARLPELIRDEIKARTFFVLCKTRASRRSKWVKQEIELVKQVTKRPRKTVVVMNLERDLQTERMDLRWGVPARDANGETTNSWKYCRRWIDCVELFFVCILDQRYGWVPPRKIRPIIDDEGQSGVLDATLSAAASSLAARGDGVLDFGDEYYH